MIAIDGRSYCLAVSNMAHPLFSLAGVCGLPLFNRREASYLGPLQDTFLSFLCLCITTYTTIFFTPLSCTVESYILALDASIDVHFMGMQMLGLPLSSMFSFL